MKSYFMINNEKQCTGVRKASFRPLSHAGPLSPGLSESSYELRTGDTALNLTEKCA